MNYAVIELETLPGHTGSMPLGMDQQGTIVGISGNADQCRVFLFREGILNDLGEVYPQYTPVKIFVNVADKIVGLAYPTDDVVGLSETPPSPYVFKGDRQGIFPVVFPDEIQVEDITGISENGDFTGTCSLDGTFHAFLRVGEETHILFEGISSGMNRSGQIIGCLGKASSDEPAFDDGTVVIWHNQSLKSIYSPAMCAKDINFQAINDQGEVFLFTPEGFLLLTSPDYVGQAVIPDDTPPFLTFSFTGMNAKRQFTAILYADGPTHAALWENGQLFDLNETLEPMCQWHLVSAVGISDSGLIACCAIPLTSKHKDETLADCRTLLLKPI